MFLYHLWLELPLATRDKIANEFGIERKGAVEVFSNTVKNDGYLIKEIESSLSLSSLQNYLGTEESSLPILWGWLIDKIEGKNPEVILEVVTKKNAKTKKTNKK